jgi:transglutaminase-like putative cysteine protease
MNYRLTITAAVAVVLASFSLLTIIQGLGWLYAGIGAVAVVALAGLATRLAPIPAAVTASVLMLIAVVPLLTGHSWPGRIAGLVLLGITVASAGSRLIFPALADVGTYLAALLIYLNLVFAGPYSLGWIIPTVKSVHHLSLLASLGYDERQFAPPVPGSHGLELVTAAGIGAVAILTDLLAVRMRSPAVAGLPLLVLFSVPVATAVKHVGAELTLAFCLGITGYLALLAADGRERLRLWGRLVTVWQDDPDAEDTRGPDTRAVAASGRRIGLAAVAIAIVIPLTLPSLKEHGVFGRDPVPGGSGNGTAVPPNPLVQMRSQLLGSSNRTFLTYQTTAADVREQYLQVYVLNYDSGSGQWTLSNQRPSTSIGSAPMRPVPGLAPITPYEQSRTTITIGKSSGYSGQVNFLPMPYAATGITVPGKGWQETDSTLMMYGFRPDAGLKYTVTSHTATPSPAELSVPAKIPASVQPYLQYAGPDKAALLKIARKVTKGDHSHFSQAETLENYFQSTGGFTYSLAKNPPSTVLQFLTTDKTGFCQQFAFSMAVLARLLGIPSRIAVGYTAGTYIGHHTWKVTSADAHAWPELYFPGAGWLRFEPTPGGAGGQGTAIQPVYSAPVVPTGPSTNPGAGSTSPLTAPSTGVAPVAPNIRKTGPEIGGTSSQGAATKPAGFPIGLVIAAVLILLLIGPGLIRLITRRRRWLTATDDIGRAHAAWRELTSDLVDYRLGAGPSETPRAVARRISDVGELDATGRQAVDRIAAAEERAQYARTPASCDTLRSDVHTVRRAMARAARPGDRWRARLLPASVLRPVLGGLRQALDVFGWLDAGSLRLRRLAGGAWQARRAH